mmetsp:Transcript_21433/g.23779  ORF Transcript_21433/g.23779 Transcript_21433/m.23779 type:complete len:252 (-) Transcript_21433:98-853(-)
MRLRRSLQARRGSGPPATAPACCDLVAKHRWRAGRPDRLPGRSERLPPSAAWPGSVRSGRPRSRRQRLSLRCRYFPSVRPFPPKTPERCAVPGADPCGCRQRTPGRRGPSRLPPRRRRNRHQRRLDRFSPAAAAIRRRRLSLGFLPFEWLLCLGLLLRDSFRQRFVPAVGEDRRHRLRPIPSTGLRQDPLFPSFLRMKVTTTTTEMPARDLTPTPPPRRCPRRHHPRGKCTERPCWSRPVPQKSQRRGCGP